MSLYAYDTLEQLGNLPKYVYRADTVWNEDQIRWIDLPNIYFDSLTKKNEIDSLKPIDTWETFNVIGYTKGFLRGEYENNGYIITTSELSSVYFRSSEYHDIQYRPKLELLISDNLSPVVNVISPIPEDIIPSEGTANISWSGTDDGGINGFALYYSLDYGDSWTFIDSVNGLTDQYDWITPKVNYKSRCYIKIVIFDDKWKSSEGQTHFWIDKATDNFIQINNQNTELFNIKIGNHIFNINVPGNNKNARLSLKDIKGRLIKCIKIDEEKREYSFDNRFTSGIYFIEVDGIKGHKYYQRVLIH